MRQAMLDWLKAVGLSWFWKQLGVGKWLRERALHVPQGALPALAAEAAARANLTTLTPSEQMSFWRACESVIADAADGALTSQVDRLIAQVKI